jgi:hypothetical protein
MQSSCDIDPGRRLITVILTGEVGLEQLADARARVVSDPAFRADFRMLVDLSFADLAPVDAPGLRGRARHPPAAAPMAIVAGSDTTYGMARMYELASSACVSVFRSRDEALRWLESQP